MSTFKKAMAATAVVALSSAILALGGGTANAATFPAPPYEPDANAAGTLTFYDAAGHVVTGGDATKPISAYVVGSAPLSAVGSKANLFGYVPKVGQAPGAFSGEQLAGPTVFPVTAAPIPVGDSPNPAIAITPTDFTFANLSADFPNTAPAGDPLEGLYAIRIKTTDTRYLVADVKITPTATGGKVWQQVYPNVNASTTTLSVSPASSSTTPVDAGTNVTLTANVTGTGVAGRVQFFDNGALINTAPVTAGAASFTSAPAIGTHAYSATYVPNVGSNSLDSSAANTPATTTTVAAPKPASFTSVVTNAGPTTNDQSPVTATATVKSPDAAGSPVTTGSVTFTDSVDGSLGTVPVSSTGTAAVTKAFTATAGTSQHVITASYSDPANFKASSASAPGFAVTQSGTCAQPGSNCTDPQTLKVVVGPGTLTISTPYTPTNQFDLGTMQLSTDGKHLSAAAAFGSVANPNAGVTITDRRSGDLPWDASLSAQPFKDAAGDVINAQNLGFTGVAPVYVSGDALNPTTKPVTTTSRPSDTVDGYAPTAAGTAGLSGSKIFAHATNGAGSVNVVGSMNLVAPASTPAGTYTSVVTFTIG